MPSKASKYCYKCSRIAVAGGLCEVHRKAADKLIYDRRDNKWLWMYKSAEWQAMRRVQLSKEPLCFECLKDNLLTEATVADHIVPHRGNPVLFFDPTNLQSMCDHHHSMKTAQEDGGFGNRAARADDDE